MTFFAIVGVIATTIPFILALTVLGVLWRTWWLYPAWAWYIVPLGLPPITFWHFGALLLLLDTLKTVSTRKDDRPVEWGSLAFVLLWPMGAWLLLRWMR